MNSDHVIGQRPAEQSPAGRGVPTIAAAGGAPDRPWDVMLLVLVSAWVAVLFVAFAPGLMTVDSLIQYGQGIRGEYSNQHPPFSSWLAGICARVVGSPWPLLLLQLTVLGAGIALLVRRIDARRRVAALGVVLAFLVVPTVWAIAVALWKDVYLAATLLAVVVLLRSRRPWLALVLACVASLLRHNAVFAAAPLVVPAVLQIRVAVRPRLARAVVGGVAVVAMVAAPKLAERALHTRDEWMLGQLLVYDLAGIYVDHPEALSRSIFAGDFTREDLLRCYDVGVIPLVFKVGPGLGIIPFESLPARRGAIEAEWLRVVSRYPWSYVKHRAMVMRALLRIDTPVYYTLATDIDPNPWGLRLRSHTVIHRWLRYVANASESSLVFKGWFWLALVAGAAALSMMQRNLLALSVASSGIAYALGYAVIAVAPDFRYLYWTVVATFASVALVVAGSGREAGERRGARGGSWT